MRPIYIYINTHIVPHRENLVLQLEKQIHERCREIMVVSCNQMKSINSKGD
jgi:hypothetical protein